MRVFPLALVLALLVPQLAGAHRRVEEDRRRGVTAEQAADAVVDALRRDDADALEALANRTQPNPWYVADELCLRGSHDAAETFVRAGEAPDADALSRYVGRSRTREPDEPARRRRTAVRAAGTRRDPGTILRLASAPAPDLSRVVGVDLAGARAGALLALGRLAEAADAYDVAARAAEELGWLSCAAHMVHQSGSCAWRRADYATTLERWTRRLAIERARGPRGDEVGTLGNLGNVYAAQGRLDEALSLQKRALAIVETRGDLRGQAQMLLNLGQILRAQGESREAHASFEDALALHEKIDDPALLAATRANRGYLQSDLGRFLGALADQEQALAILATLGDQDGVARTLGNIGNILYALGRFGEALDHLDASLRILEEGGDRAAVARTLGTLGLVLQASGDYEEALDCHLRALALQQKLEDRIGLAATLRHIGAVHTARGAFGDALASYEKALEVLEAVGNAAGVAATISGIGRVHAERGDSARALAFFERAKKIQERIGDRAAVASSLGSIAAVHLALGDYARALALHEQSLEMVEAMGRRVSVARALGNIGLVYQACGDEQTSLDYQQRALALMEAAGDRPDVARSLGNIGSTWIKLGEPYRALAYLERARAASEKLGDRVGAAAAWGHIAKCRRACGDLEHAQADLEEVVRLLDALGDRARATTFRWELGSVLMEAGDTTTGRRILDRALRDARRLRATPLLVRFLPQLARHRLEVGEADQALLTAQQALALTETLLGGLGEEEGTSARAEHVNVFDVGTVASARLADAGSMLEFLESGRAGALLESLGNRRPLRWADVPEALHRAEAESHAAASQARRAYARALDGRRLVDIRRSAKALDESLERVRAVSARFQRQAKRQAGLLYPRAATLEEVQGWLEPHEALVLYSLCLGETMALVLTPNEAHIRSLGDARAVEAACRGLVAGERNETTHEALVDLRTRLVEPLLLPDAVSTVLVSPEGPLCYLPFGALFEDRAVAITPSGTTHALLRDEAGASGSQVLALGDPDYGADPDPAAEKIYRRGTRLVPLPATRTEAMTVGDVVLLGRDACESTLREAIAGQNRWRAVHLACHGLVDVERPTLSSLALTRAGDEDGFLTAREVLRMKIPADLAVLSACETARGRLVRGEGILGLTRAFMYAGASRVLCSLWRVDDEATRALMTKFYELWTKETSAAEALRAAQTFVRTQERWNHPHYWAAWVLWGLP